MLKPPPFWQKKEGANHPLAITLSPLAALYDWVGKNKRRKQIPFVAGKPVICVGNVSMGGVGKTPFAILLAKLLAEKGISPAFLTRGYGGKEKGPLLVSEAADLSTIGDEAQLLATHAQTCISASRPEGASYLEEKTSLDVILMDDGFQNPSLKKDLSFILVDGEVGFGNGRVFPSGALREKPADAVVRAQAIVFVLPSETYELPEELLSFAQNRPVFKAWLEVTPIEMPEEAVAFCGIGRPEKFYRSAKEAGYNLISTHDFPDHYAFKQEDLASLIMKAQQANATLLTTEKDYVRLPAAYQKQVRTLPVTMQVDKKQALQELILNVVERGAAS